MRYPTPETAAKIEGYQKSKYIPESKEIENTLNYYDNLYKEQLKKKPSWYHGLETRDNFYWEGLSEDEANKIFKDFRRSEQWEQSPEGQQYFKDLNKITAETRKYENSVMQEDYIPQHQTILKKYADFPKQYQKLFKGSEVRTVTDAKGNTWYEVDVPQSFLNGSAEMQFKLGGKFNYVSYIKNTPMS